MRKTIICLVAILLSSTGCTSASGMGSTKVQEKELQYAGQLASDSCADVSEDALGQVDIEISEEVMEHFFIEADIHIPKDKYRIYQTALKKFDKNSLIDMLMPNAEKSEIQVESSDSGNLSIKYQMERLSLGSGYLRYIKDNDIQFIQQLMDMADEMELLEQKELGFMQSKEAADMAEFFLNQLNLGVIPGKATISACTKEQLGDIQEYFLKYDEHFRQMSEQGKVTTRDTFTDEDETYFIKYNFSLDGLPVFNPDEPGLYAMGGIDAPPPSQPMEAVFCISSSGIRFIQLYNVIDGEWELSEEREILQVDGIREALIKKYGDIILTEDIKVTDIWLEYIPLRDKADYQKVQLVPAWCCELYTDVSEAEENFSDILHADRFHAITGEVIS